MTELLSVNDEHADRANNFRAAVLGQDPAGLITTSSHISVDFDVSDVKGAVLGGDLTAILRILTDLNTPQLNKIDLLPLDDLKVSVTSQDPASLIYTMGRLLGTDGDSWIKYDNFRKVVLAMTQNSTGTLYLLCVTYGVLILIVH